MFTEWILRRHGGRGIAWLFAVLFLACGWSRADFHEWRIQEIYSSADGTIQFIEMGCPEADETQIKGQKLTCSRNGATNTFTFPNNLSQSLNKKLLLATPAFTNRPGAVPPDYIIPAQFVFLGNGKVKFANVDVVNYTGLPNNEISSLTKSGNGNWGSATNSPKNFAGQSGSLVPVRILTKSFSNGEFRMSFASAPGKNYAVEYKNTHATAVWQTFTTVPGSGGIIRVTNQVPVNARIYRLKVQ